MNTIDRIIEIVGEIEGILNAFKNIEENPSKTVCQCGDNKHHRFPNNLGVQILKGDLDDLIKELNSLIKYHLEDELDEDEELERYPNIYDEDIDEEPDYGETRNAQNFSDKEEDFADVESPQERFNLMNGIPDGITKGALMEQVYTKEELGNIDASLPREIHLTYGVDAFFFVMNYNKNVFGELEDMRKLIKQPTTIVTGRVK